MALAFWRHGRNRCQVFHETPFLNSLKSEYGLDCDKTFPVAIPMKIVSQCRAGRVYNDCRFRDQKIGLVLWSGRGVAVQHWGRNGAGLKLDCQNRGEIQR